MPESFVRPTSPLHQDFGRRTRRGMPLGVASSFWSRSGRTPCFASSDQASGCGAGRSAHVCFRWLAGTPRPRLTATLNWPPTTGRGQYNPAALPARQYSATIRLVARRVPALAPVFAGRS